MISIAIITTAVFNSLHSYINITAGTNPTTTDFDGEWVPWAEGMINSYLQTGSTLPTDQGDIIKGVADNLLVQKWAYERKLGHTAPEDNPLPTLTGEDKGKLDSLKGQNPSIEAPAFVFDLDRTVGGYD